MNALLKILTLYYRTGLRGSTRLFELLSHRFKSLQCVPITVEGGILYADLRLSSGRDLLAYPTSHTGEQLVMRRFVSKGDSVFDIGAHLGIYTVLLSSLVGDSGRVYAFEPNPEIFPSLRKTIGALSNVELREVGLSNTSGEMDLHIPEDPSMASILNWTEGIAGKVHSQRCRMERIDDLIGSGSLPLPQFIKCDVEGAELEVFRGGQKTLNRQDAPIILFELNRRAAAAFNAVPKDYIDFLSSFELAEYKFFRVQSDGIVPLSPEPIEYSNVVAVPSIRVLAKC